MTRWTKAAFVLLTGALALLATACPGQPPAGNGTSAGNGVWAVNQIDTDPALAYDALNLNRAFAPDVGTTPINKLAVIFPGTSAQTSAFTSMTASLTSIGYHVIILRYSSGTATNSACPDSVAATDPDCHRAFRSEIVFGQNVTDPDGQAYNSAAVSNPAPLSVANRLIKLLDYLNRVAPTAGWSQFQMRTGPTCDQTNPTYGGCDVDWSNLALMGHSQGSGVALYLAKFFPVTAVGMASGPIDAFNVGSTVLAAPWTSEPLAVPTNKMTTFTHVNDFGRSLINAVEVSVGIPGAEVNVVNTAAPYDGSHQLITDAQAANLCLIGDSAPGHNSTGVDACAPPYLYWPVWRYMANGGS